MNTRTITVVTVMMAVAGLAQARAKNPVPAQVVKVCMGKAFAEAELARLVTSDIYAGIDVRIDWKSMNHCPAEAIQISFKSGNDPGQPSDALAYAMPYERVHIFVFGDRIRKLSGGNGEASLLGHVLAHEIGHVLEGVARHSETGVMKPGFTAYDLFRMRRNLPLSFASEDADMIHDGIAGRIRLLGRTPPTAESGKVVRVSG
jgi:hypothetical protein